MSLQPDDVVWVFDGRKGIRAMMKDLVGGYLVSIQALMPPSALGNFPDPFSAMAADEEFRALDHVRGVRLERLFPRPVAEELDEDAGAFEGIVRSRATALHGHAHVVLAELSGSRDLVAVREEHVQAWLQTFGALRAALHADLAGTARPDAEPTREQIDAEPALAAVLDWLAFKIEELLETRRVCAETGTGLDVSELEEWE